MLPISQICVPPINPAIALSTVIASWITLFQTLGFNDMNYQFMKVESHLPGFDERKQKSNARIQSPLEELAHFVRQ